MASKEGKTVELNDAQRARYSRHLLLPEVGEAGQTALLASHALIVGVGGLGSPVAMYMASAGVGTITLVDHDVVSLSNLQRQILHGMANIGELKVDSGKQRLAALNPDIDVRTVGERLTLERLDELVKAADVVLDCTDNFPTRHAINRACVENRTPLVSGGALQFDGQLSVYDSSKKDAPCYACLFPEEMDFPDTVSTPQGVFAPLVGMIGTSQAAEAIKLLAGAGAPLIGTLLMLDARDMAWSKVRISRNEACLVCGDKP